MINITRNKRLYAQKIMRQNLLLELDLYKKVNPILNTTYTEVAEGIKHGDYLNVVPIFVNKKTNALKKIYYDFYRQIGLIGFKLIDDRLNEIKPKGFSKYDTKAANYNFWYHFDLWAKRESMSKVTKIDATTKKSLSNMIDKSIKDGKDYRQISKDILTIKEITTKHRAMAIATTETHTAFNKGIFESIEQSDVEMETKEWMNAGDERVREGIFDHVRAQGEIVGMDEYFILTGGELLFPGDSNSSGSDPANIIRCRCIALYYTESGRTSTHRDVVEEEQER